MLRKKRKRGSARSLRRRAIVRPCRRSLSAQRSPARSASSFPRSIPIPSARWWRASLPCWGEKGYFLLLANTENNEKAELNYLDIFSRNKVDGIILIGTVMTEAHREAFSSLTIPFVLAAQQADGVSCVYYDDYGAAYALTNLLLDKGSAIGYIGVREDDKAAGYNRKHGFLAALNERGIRFDPSYGEVALFSMQSGYEQASELFARHPEIDSLFCATDHIAAGALLYLKGAGKSVPEQVRVAGVGGRENFPRDLSHADERPSLLQ